MSLAQLPGRTEPLVDDNDLVTLPWQIAFENMAVGDAGVVWTPLFTGLGITGTPTITGKYYRISGKLAYFTVTIVPATDTTSTAGVTYCSGFPLTITNDSFDTVTDGIVSSSGGVSAATQRIYTPAWTAATTKLTITGIIEVQ